MTDDPTSNDPTVAKSGDDQRIVLRFDLDDTEATVWLDDMNGWPDPSSNAICIGTGPTVALALRDAELNLESWRDRVRQVIRAGAIAAVEK